MRTQMDSIHILERVCVCELQLLAYRVPKIETVPHRKNESFNYWRLFVQIWNYISLKLGLVWRFVFFSFRTAHDLFTEFFFSRVFKCARLAHKTLNTGTVLIGGTVQERVRYI